MENGAEAPEPSEIAADLSKSAELKDATPRNPVKEGEVHHLEKLSTEKISPPANNFKELTSADDDSVGNMTETDHTMSTQSVANGSGKEDHSESAAVGSDKNSSEINPETSIDNADEDPPTTDSALGSATEWKDATSDQILPEEETMADEIDSTAPPVEATAMGEPDIDIEQLPKVEHGARETPSPSESEQHSSVEEIKAVESPTDVQPENMLNEMLPTTESDEEAAPSANAAGVESPTHHDDLSKDDRVTDEKPSTPESSETLPVGNGKEIDTDMPHDELTTEETTEEDTALATNAENDDMESRKPQEEHANEESVADDIASIPESAAPTLPLEDEDVRSTTGQEDLLSTEKNVAGEKSLTNSAEASAVEFEKNGLPSPAEDTLTRELVSAPESPDANAAEDDNDVEPATANNKDPKEDGSVASEIDSTKDTIEAGDVVEEKDMSLTPHEEPMKGEKEELASTAPSLEVTDKSVKPARIEQEFPKEESVTEEVHSSEESAEDVTIGKNEAPSSWEAAESLTILEDDQVPSVQATVGENEKDIELSTTDKNLTEDKNLAGEALHSPESGMAPAVEGEENIMAARLHEGYAKEAANTQGSAPESVYVEVNPIEDDKGAESVTVDEVPGPEEPLAEGDTMTSVTPKFSVAAPFKETKDVDLVTGDEDFSKEVSTTDEITSTTGPAEATSVEDKDTDSLTPHAKFGLDDTVTDESASTPNSAEAIACSDDADAEHSTVNAGVAKESGNNEIPSMADSEDGTAVGEVKGTQSPFPNEELFKEANQVHEVHSTTESAPAVGVEDGKDVDPATADKELTRDDSSAGELLSDVEPSVPPDQEVSAEFPSAPEPAEVTPVDDRDAEPRLGIEELSKEKSIGDSIVSPTHSGKSVGAFDNKVMESRTSLVKPTNEAATDKLASTPVSVAELTDGNPEASAEEFSTEEGVVDEITSSTESSGATIPEDNYNVPPSIGSSGATRILENTNVEPADTEADLLNRESGADEVAITTESGEADASVDENGVDENDATSATTNEDLFNQENTEHDISSTKESSGAFMGLEDKDVEPALAKDGDIAPKQDLVKDETGVDKLAFVKESARASAPLKDEGVELASTEEELSNEDFAVAKPDSPIEDEQVGSAHPVHLLSKDESIAADEAPAVGSTEATAVVENENLQPSGREEELSKVVKGPIEEEVSNEDIAIAKPDSSVEEQVSNVDVAIGKPDSLIEDDEVESAHPVEVVSKDESIAADAAPAAGPSEATADLEKENLQPSGREEELSKVAKGPTEEEVSNEDIAIAKPDSPIEEDQVSNEDVAIGKPDSPIKDDEVESAYPVEVLSEDESIAADTAPAAGSSETTADIENEIVQPSGHEEERSKVVKGPTEEEVSNEDVASAKPDLPIEDDEVESTHPVEVLSKDESIATDAAPAAGSNDVTAGLENENLQPSGREEELSKVVKGPTEEEVSNEDVATAKPDSPIEDDEVESGHPVEALSKDDSVAADVAPAAGSSEATASVENENLQPSGREEKLSKVVKGPAEEEVFNEDNATAKPDSPIEDDEVESPHPVEVLPKDDSIATDAAPAAGSSDATAGLENENLQPSGREEELSKVVEGPTEEEVSNEDIAITKPDSPIEDEEVESAHPVEVLSKDESIAADAAPASVSSEASAGLENENSDPSGCEEELSKAGKGPDELLLQSTGSSETREPQDAALGQLIAEGGSDETVRDTADEASGHASKDETVTRVSPLEPLMSTADSDSDPGNGMLSQKESEEVNETDLAAEPAEAATINGDPEPEVFEFEEDVGGVPEPLEESVPETTLGDEASVTFNEPAGAQESSPHVSDEITSTVEPGVKASEGGRDREFSLADKEISEENVAYKRPSTGESTEAKGPEAVWPEEEPSQEDSAILKGDQVEEKNDKNDIGVHQIPSVVEPTEVRTTAEDTPPDDDSVDAEEPQAAPTPVMIGEPLVPTEGDTGPDLNVEDPGHTSADTAEADASVSTREYEPLKIKANGVKSETTETKMVDEGVDFISSEDMASATDSPTQQHENGQVEEKFKPDRKTVTGLETPSSEGVDSSAPKLEDAAEQPEFYKPDVAPSSTAGLDSTVSVATENDERCPQFHSKIREDGTDDMLETSEIKDVDTADAGVQVETPAPVDVVSEESEVDSTIPVLGPKDFGARDEGNLQYSTSDTQVEELGGDNTPEGASDEEVKDIAGSNLLESKPFSVGNIDVLEEDKEEQIREISAGTEALEDGSRTGESPEKVISTTDERDISGTLGGYVDKEHAPQQLPPQADLKEVTLPEEIAEKHVVTSDSPVERARGSPPIKLDYKNTGSSPGTLEGQVVQAGGMQESSQTEQAIADTTSDANCKNGEEQEISLEKSHKVALACEGSDSDDSPVNIVQNYDPTTMGELGAAITSSSKTIQSRDLNPGRFQNEVQIAPHDSEEDEASVPVSTHTADLSSSWVSVSPIRKADIQVISGDFRPNFPQRFQQARTDNEVPSGGNDWRLVSEQDISLVDLSNHQSQSKDVDNRSSGAKFPLSVVLWCSQSMGTLFGSSKR